MKYYNQFKQFFKQNNGPLIVLTTFISGLICHFYQYVNNIIFYDGYWNFPYHIAAEWEITLGRFLLPTIDGLREGITTGIMVIIVGLLLFSIINMLIINLLDIKHNYLKVLICILMVINPVFSTLLLFQYTTISYFLAIFFAVLSVYCLHQKTTWFNICLALSCMVLSLSLYQAYFCVMVSLEIIIFFCHLLKNESHLSAQLKLTIRNYLLIFLGCILYFIILLLFLKIKNLSLSSYGGANEKIYLTIFQNLPHFIRNSYNSFYKFFFTDEIYFNLNWHRHIYYAILIGIIGLNTIILIRQNKLKLNKIWLLLLIGALYPVFSSAIKIIGETISLNYLMGFSYLFIFLVLFKQLDSMNLNIITDVIKWLSLGVIILLFGGYFYSNNATYVTIDQFDKQTEASIQRIQSYIIQNYPQYLDKKVLYFNNIKFSGNKIQFFMNFSINSGFPWISNSVANIYSNTLITADDHVFYGYPFNDETVIKTINAMPAYPDPNSLWQYQDYLIVKLG